MERYGNRKAPEVSVHTISILNINGWLSEVKLTRSEKNLQSINVHIFSQMLIGACSRKYSVFF